MLLCKFSIGMKPCFCLFPWKVAWLRSSFNIYCFIKENILEILHVWHMFHVIIICFLRLVYAMMPVSLDCLFYYPLGILYRLFQNNSKMHKLTICTVYHPRVLTCQYCSIPEGSEWTLFNFLYGATIIVWSDIDVFGAVTWVCFVSCIDVLHAVWA